MLHLRCVGPGITYCDVSVAPRTPAPWDAREYGSEVLAHIRPCEAPHVRHRSLFPVIGTEHSVQRLVHSNPRHCTSPPTLATTSLAQGCGDVSVITTGTPYSVPSTEYRLLPSHHTLTERCTACFRSLFSSPSTGKVCSVTSASMQTLKGSVVMSCLGGQNTNYRSCFGQELFGSSHITLSRITEWHA